MKKYEKIFNDLIEEMKDGSLKKGDRLPSIRLLSKKYDCSKSTVIKALNELSLQSYIYSVEKSGYYVFRNIDEKSDDVDFVSSLPDSAGFPFNDFKACVSETMDYRENYLFDYNSKLQGLGELIDSFYNLMNSYSVYAKKEQIVVTSGTQQALYILSVMKIDGNDSILVEQPTYSRMNELIKNLGLKYETIERRVSGIDLKRLEEIFKSGKIKFFYTMPRLHNPLGANYSKEEKKRIVELAAQYDVYLIEDDYMADFALSGNAPLHYYDVNDKVVYIKSFSSIIFPSLRIASVVLPKTLIKEFLVLKNAMDYDSNLLIQKALSTYIDNGMFAKHRQRQLSLYESKHRKLKEILDKSDVKYYLIYDTKTVFQIKDASKIAQLKKVIDGRYKVDFIEGNYISRCPYIYVKIDVRNMNVKDIDKNVNDLLADLKDYIE